MALLAVIPDRLEPYFKHADRAINIWGLNGMIASNGTTGRIMVCLISLYMFLHTFYRVYVYNDLHIPRILYSVKLSKSVNNLLNM